MSKHTPQVQVCIRETAAGRYIVSVREGKSEADVSTDMHFGSADAYAESLRKFLATGGAEVAPSILVTPHEG